MSEYVSSTNARFWVFTDAGWVKLTLRPGQKLGICHGGLTDEGWSRDWSTWELEDGFVCREYGSEGRDCDGGHATFGRDCWPVGGDLVEATEWDGTGHLFEGQRIMRPAWNDRRAWQRDEYAEAAGY